MFVFLCQDIGIIDISFGVDFTLQLILQAKREVRDAREGCGAGRYRAEFRKLVRRLASRGPGRESVAMKQASCVGVPRPEGYASAHQIGNPPPAEGKLLEISFPAVALFKFSSALPQLSKLSHAAKQPSQSAGGRPKAERRGRRHMKLASMWRLARRGRAKRAPGSFPGPAR